MMEGLHDVCECILGASQRLFIAEGLRRFDPDVLPEVFDRTDLTPRERLLAVFDIHAPLCPFIAPPAQPMRAPRPGILDTGVMGYAAGAGVVVVSPSPCIAGVLLGGPLVAPPVVPRPPGHHELLVGAGDLGQEGDGTGATEGGGRSSAVIDGDGAVSVGCVGEPAWGWHDAMVLRGRRRHNNDSGLLCLRAAPHPWTRSVSATSQDLPHRARTGDLASPY